MYPIFNELKKNVTMLFRTDSSNSMLLLNQITSGEGADTVQRR